MTLDGLSIAISANLAPLERDLASAGRALVGLTKPATDAAQTLERAFRGSFGSFESALERALLKGRFSFAGFVDAILSDLSRIAVQTLVTKPLSGFLTDLLGSALNFGGGRAVGGPVLPGEAYLVGERGPEFFVPGRSGSIVPAEAAARGSARPIVVNIMANDAQSVLRSESQVAAMLARALARGQRNA